VNWLLVAPAGLGLATSRQLVPFQRSVIFGDVPFG